MTNLRAIQKNYYPPRFVRSAWYLLIRSSWSFIWRSSVFFSSGPEAVRSSRPRASTCSQIDSRGHGESGGTEGGRKSRPPDQHALAGNPACNMNQRSQRADFEALVQACEELGVEHEARTVTKPFSA